MKPGSLNVVRLVTLLALLATLSCAGADTKLNPYETIAVSNPFHLKDPPPPVDPNDLIKPPPVVLATVEVTGILNIFQKKQVCLEIVPAPGKPVVRRTLGEGERDDAITVVSIDLEKNEVVLDNAGVVTNLTLKAAAKGTAAGPVAGVPSPLILPGVPAGYVPPAGVPAGVPAHAGAAANSNPSGRGNPMVAGGTPYGAAATGAAHGNPYGANPGAYHGGAGFAPAAPGINNPGANTSVDSFRSIPPRTIRAQVTQPESPPIDPAVQYINMAVQKQQADRAGKPFPPLPPVPGLDHPVNQ